MTHVGRKPQGAKLVDELGGSTHAKRRMKLFLETLAGHCTVPEACAELGIGPSRFFAQRARWMQESLDLLEPRAPGRPPMAAPPASLAEVQALQERARELESRAAAVEVQADLARTLPHVVQRAASAGKKTIQRGRRPRRRTKSALR